MSKNLKQTQLPYDEKERDAQKRNSLRRRYNKEVEQLVIPDPPAKSKTKPSTCKQVLAVLNEKIGTYEACRMYLSTIMEKTGIRQRATLVYALSYLKSIGLVKWQRTGRSNVFEISRDKVSQMIDDQTSDGGLSNNRESAHRTSEVRSSTQLHTLSSTDLSTASLDEWKAVAEKVRQARLSFADDFVDEAIRLGKTPEAVVEAVDTFKHPANSQLLNSPGSLFTWLRTGKWPADGVRTATEIEAARALEYPRLHPPRPTRTLPR